MRSLSACEALHVLEWEREPSSTDKAVALLELACPERTRAELLELPIGARGALLLELREVTFGPILVARSTCPGCSEALELRLDIATLLAARASGRNVEQEETFDVGGYSVRIRPLRGPDLDDASACTSVEAARALLFDRFVLEVRRDGEDVALADLPEDASARLSEILDRIDPLADLRLGYTCPGCGHQGEALLDPADFLWRELRDRAMRLLQDIDVLARAYGWRESDILAMSPSRRQMYMELVSA